MSVINFNPIYNNQYATTVTIKWYIRTTSPYEPGEVRHEVEQTVNELLDKIPERFQELSDEEIEIVTEQE